MSNKLTYSWIAGIMGLMVASIMNNFGWKLTVLTNMLVFGGIIGLFISKITTDVIKTNYFYRIFSGPIITGVCVGVIGGIIFGGNPVEAGLALAILNVFWLLIPLFGFALIVYKESESFVTWFSLLFCIIFGTIDGGWLLDAEFGINRYSTTSFPLFIIPLFAFIGYITGKHSDKKADYEAKINQQYLQSVPGLFDTAKHLSSQAAKLFQQKNYPTALQTYENALSHFTRAYEGAKALNDNNLVNSISNNISSVQKNITACKNTIGAEIASKARSKFEKGDFAGAIQTYEESLKYFQDAELIAKTKTNIESCYVEIDAKRVEELSTQAVSLLKKAVELNEPFKARDILKQADNIIDESVLLAMKRKFKGTLSQLNAISNKIRAQRDIMYDRISGEAVVSADYKIEPVVSKTSPAIPTLPDSQIESNIKRGFVVLPNNDIKFGIRMTNNMGYTITDVDTILDYNEELFNFKDSKIQRIGNLAPNSARTATYLLKPLGCIHNEQINALVTYKDHTGKKQTLHMRPKEVHCVCPFLKEKPLSEGEYSRLVAGSEFVQEGISFKGIIVEELAKFMGETCRHMLYKVREYDIEGKKVIYLSGESVGEKAYYLLTAVIQDYKGLTQVVLRAHSDKKYGLNGFMNEMADSLRHLVGSVQNAKEIGIIEKTQVINIIDSLVQRTNFNMGDGGSSHVNIKESVVQRSNIEFDIGVSKNEKTNIINKEKGNEISYLEKKETPIRKIINAHDLDIAKTLENPKRIRATPTSVSYSNNIFTFDCINEKGEKIVLKANSERAVRYIHEYEKNLPKNWISLIKEKGFIPITTTRDSKRGPINWYICDGYVAFFTTDGYDLIGIKDVLPFLKLPVSWKLQIVSEERGLFGGIVELSDDIDAIIVDFGYNNGNSSIKVELNNKLVDFKPSHSINQKEKIGDYLNNIMNQLSVKNNN